MKNLKMTRNNSIKMAGNHNLIIKKSLFCSVQKRDSILIFF